MDTELKLLNWRDGSTKAERLSANILALDGFSSIDPQCPLGGPDGLKDIVCEKNNWKYIGAAYFPPTQKAFKDIKEKFLQDLKGVAKNNVNGLVFVTNQRLSPKQKQSLVALGLKQGHECIIYHCESIRVLLDNPDGFALRLEYLGIKMSKEEQLSFFSQWNRIFEDLLQNQSSHIVSEITKLIKPLLPEGYKIEDLKERQIVTTQNTASQFTLPQASSDKKNLSFPSTDSTTGALTVEILCMLHKAIAGERGPLSQIGKIRKVRVWVGGPKLENARYVPPEPEQVLQLTNKLLDWWNKEYPTLMHAKNKNLIINAIVNFHYRFLFIHPFIDANGRLARFILAQQAMELLGHNKRIIIEDKAPYLEALNDAHKGNLDPLRRIITQAIYGTEEVDEEF